jgi:predicted amidohydrolase YtcJ
VRKSSASSRLTTAIVVIIVAGTFVAGIITRAQRDVGPVDLIVLNGKVYTGDDRTFAEAVAVQGNKIVSVGSNRDIKRLRRPQTTVVDAHGGTVLPGFNDSYVHFVEGSGTLRALNLTDALTVDDVAARLKDYAEHHEDDEWIVGHGWDPAAIGPGAPMRVALDEAVQDRPVFLSSADGRMAWVNSEALVRAGITRATPSPSPGAIVRNTRGQPSGLFRDAGLDLVRAVMPARTLEERLTSLRTGIEEAHRVGVTSVHNAGSEAGELAAFDALRSSGDLRLRVYQAIEVPGAATDADLARLDDARKQYGDDPVLKTGAVEVAADGLTREALSKLVGTLDRRGWQVWIRTHSSQAVQWALGAFQAAAQANGAATGERRHRLNHAGAMSPEDAKRISRLNVIASLPAPGIAEELASANGRVALGSEWPRAALDPRRVIRDTAGPSGETPELELPRTFTVKRALAAYTSAGAYASFDDQRKGSLALGMLADIVILSADIFATPPERLLDVNVDVTIFDGAVVYARAD